MKKILIVLMVITLSFIVLNCNPNIVDSGDSGDGGSDMLSLTINIIGNGSVTLNPPGGMYEPETEVTITAIPDSNNVFIGWQSPFVNSKENEIKVILNSSRTIDAIFYNANVNLYELTVDNPSGVYVEVSPDSIYYLDGVYLFEENEQLTLLATDTSCGTTFDSWGGDLSGSDNPATLTMDSDKYVSASVVPAFRLTLNYDEKFGIVGVNPSGISVGTCQYKYKQGTNVIITAQPNSGYSFVEWSGDLISTNNPESIIMNDDYLIDAIFSQD